MSTHILIEENHGVIAICESGGVKKVFNYINAESIPKKKGDKSAINTKERFCVNLGDNSNPI